MTEAEEQIAKLYLLPKRPFLHGMAKVFDIFGVLEGSVRDSLVASFRQDLPRANRGLFRATCRELGDELIAALDAYKQELEAGEG